jgi:DNA replication regulator SLD3
VEQEPHVLIVEEGDDKRLSAIERTSKRTYALCKLKEGVELKSPLYQTPFVERRHDETQSKRRALQSIEGSQPWWSRAAVPLPAQDGARTADVLKPSPGPEDTILQNDVQPAEAVANAERTPEIAANADPFINPEIPTGASDVLRELAKQYLETLYLSRTSLAYFAKGPLSRARAAFSSVDNPDLSVNELVSFTREAILTSSVMDTKYRDSISGFIGELAPGLNTPEQTTKAKKKRKWKAKRDKTGFFVDEKEYVMKWWQLQDDATAPSTTETADAGVTRRVPRIRSRETYLQIMLILETLALEAQPSVDDTAQPILSEDAQAQNAQNDDSKTSEKVKKPRAKKAQDLPALLDVSLDRLCIWHSLESYSPAKRSDEAGADKPDELKSFCIEVIVPFYQSRIPKYANVVNKKLGGPNPPTPVKRKTTSRRPGEPAMRQVPESKPRHPLSGVPSEALNRPLKRVPGLHRSATDSDVLRQRLKRESSEVPPAMDSIPAIDQINQPRKRASLMHTISSSRREVDFSAMSQANETKMRKKAEVEEKLREAITMLKKPNRALAVKDVAESADLSFAKATSRSRPSAKPRAVSRDAVQIAATPKHARAVRATPGRGHSSSKSAVALPSSAGSFVPSSSARVLAAPPVSHEDSTASAFAIPQTGHRPRHTNVSRSVQETPSRGFAKFMPIGLARAPGTLDSPVAARRALIKQTPVKSVRTLSLAPAMRDAIVAASPSGSRSAAPDAAEALGTVHKNNPSIYATLGWDDEYEELA